MDMTRRTFAGLGGIAALSTLPQARASVAIGRPAKMPARALAQVAPELRPAALRMLAMGQLPTLTAASLPGVRAGAVRFTTAPLAQPPVEERMVPVRPGPSEVRVYVVNAKPGTRRGAILHTHGGGFILGSAQQEVPRLQAMATMLDCVIVSVDYSLAPEARYTTSVEQNYAALRWLHRNCETIGADPARIALMGESAGGGHAAMLAFAARDRGEVPVAFQLLVYPMLDDRTGSTHHLPAAFGSIGWDPVSNVFGWRALLGIEPGSTGVPAAAVPARRTDLSGLPPTFIGVGGIDLFASEDIEFSRRLLEAGVPTQLVVVPGAFHGFDAAAADTALAQDFNAAKIKALRRAFVTV
jgi:acetyl esterase/lipase